MILLHACSELMEIPPVAEVVEFTDSGLRTAIRDAIGKPGGEIYDSDLAGLVSLPAYGRNISDLEGMQHCVDLKSLSLNGNQIADITPLSGLAKLETLWLQENEIMDISPLSGLPNLGMLWLHSNQITDVGPLVDNAGLGSGDMIRIQMNNLDLSPGSNALRDIQALIDRGAHVLYEPQNEAASAVDGATL